MNKTFANILAKLSGIVEEVKLEVAKLESGQTIEAESFEVGKPVVVMTQEGEAIALPAGTYDLDNGTTITVDDNGVITEAKPTEAPEAEAKPEAEMEAGAAAPSAAPAAQPTKRVVESETKSKETFFTKEEFETKLSAIKDEQKTELESLKATLEAYKTELEAVKSTLAAMPVERPMSRAPKSTPVAPTYEQPKSAFERLINLQTEIEKIN